MSYDLSSMLNASRPGASTATESPTTGNWWETTDLFRAIWDAAGDALALSDPEGIVLAANPAYYELYGYSAEEVLGRHFAIIFPEDAREWAAAEYKATFARPEIAPTVENAIRRKDGMLRTVETRYGFLTEQGRRTAMLSMIRDVTHRVQTQEEHIRLLRREQTASAQAADALRARDEVFSLVTHDLKNPLTAIKGLAQLLTRQAGRAPGLEEPARKKLVQGLEQIDGLATKMTAQINGLLDLGRRAPDAAPDLAAGPTDLVALARRKVEELDRVTPQHTIRFTATAPELVGAWDAAALERVLDNLLSNAIKYSPAGGPIEVEVDRAQEPPPACAVLAVCDHGIGIPAADLPHIFDRYRRAGNVGSEIAGTGLGLAAVRQIVEQHGGSIQVASEEGAGPTFTVRLPL